MIPYQKHSATSKEAAESLTTQNKMEEDILHILQIQTHGMIADEFVEHLKVNHPTTHQGTIAARLRGLELKNKVVKTKLKRMTRNNRQAHVWKLPEFAQPDELIITPRTTVPKDEADARLSDHYLNALMEIKQHCKTRHSSAAIYEIMKTIDKALTIET